MCCSLRQILPDLTVTGVTTAATAISMAASRIRKDKAADLRSNYSGTVLRSDHFVLATPAFLAIGGNPVTTEVAFRMPTEMNTCEMSGEPRSQCVGTRVCRFGGSVAVVPSPVCARICVDACVCVRACVHACVRVCMCLSSPRTHDCLDAVDCSQRTCCETWVSSLCSECLRKRRSTASLAV